MKTNYLFPNRLRPIGWILLTIGIVLGFIYLFYAYEIPGLEISTLSLFPNKGSSIIQIEKTNITYELATIAYIIGVLLVGFSKEKVEDEYIAKIRLESLLWATYATLGAQLVGAILLYNFTYLYFTFTFPALLPLIFIVCYYTKVHLLKSKSDEE